MLKNEEDKYVLPVEWRFIKIYLNSSIYIADMIFDKKLGGAHCEKD